MSSRVMLRRPDAAPAQPVHPLLLHPVFAWVGLRPVLGQHTAAEHAALKKWAAGKSKLVEIGVAEGASAFGLREVMSSEGTLWLIDPFHLSRWRSINATKRAAHRVMEGCQNGKIVWIEEFSSHAITGWHNEIDFLFVDGDHAEAAVQQDWEAWSPFVVPGGIVAFHDARVFPGGCSQPDWGPVKFVDKLFRAQAPDGWRIVQEADSLVVVERHQSPAVAELRASTLSD